MCLIVVAHRASETWPLVIAANRDEDYTRPSQPAGFWENGDVVGGRDGLHGGSWLAMSRNGRFAAVTNVRAAAKPPEGRSRGELVGGFVRGHSEPGQYALLARGRMHEYGGFHLLLGLAGRELIQLSVEPRALPPGIHGLSNAPAEVQWPKVGTAIEAMTGALQAASADVMADGLMRVLRSQTMQRDPTRDVFVRGERYGTRASTVIVIRGDDVLFVEQNFGPGGVTIGPRNSIQFRLDRNR